MESELDFVIAMNNAEATHRDIWEKKNMNENLNRAFHEAIGKCWPDLKTLDDEGICTRCGLSIESHEHPDYCADPRLVLREMRQREDWPEFITKQLHGDYCLPDLPDGTASYDEEKAFICVEDYILDETGKLAVAATEFLRKP